MPAWGYGDQLIWIVPDLDRVVPSTATWQGLGGTAQAQAASLAGAIAAGIMLAIN